MTINIISDIHGIFKNSNYQFLTGFEFCRLKPADVLVIAGDLGYHGCCYNNEIDFIQNDKSIKENFKEVVVVKGNHDFYNTEDKKYDLNFDPSYSQWNFIKEIDNTIFICSPLFSPIKKYKNVILECLSDFRFIPDWTIDKNNETFDKNLQFLYNSYNKYKDCGKNIILVTHHCPTQKLIPKEYRYSSINEAFTIMNSYKDSRLDELLNSNIIKYWIHGHIHSYVKQKINNITYIRNPIGYSRIDMFGYRNECNFLYNCIIEV